MFLVSKLNTCKTDGIENVSIHSRQIHPKIGKIFKFLLLLVLAKQATNCNMIPHSGK